MLLTKEQQQKFYDEHIRNCLNCNDCAIKSYCGDDKYNLDTMCWNVYQNWLKEKILKGDEE